jgi:hypothetical protein
MNCARDTIYYYYNGKKNCVPYPHFKDDSNTVKYVLFGNCMNKLWISKVLIFASQKMWIVSTKTMIQND